MDQNNQPETMPTSTPPSTPPASNGNHKNTLMAVLAYVLFFIPMLTGDSKKDEFVKFHTKQGFALFVVNAALYIVGWIVPFYLIFWWQISWILSLGVLALFIVGIINVVNGKKEELPVIGKIGHWLKI